MKPFLYKTSQQIFAEAKKQSWFYFKTAFVLIILASLSHLYLGSNRVVLLVAAITTLLSLLPMAYRGIFNLAAILIALVGLRYVGFPLFAKLLMAQPLDSYLLDPIGSFSVVLLGVVGYLCAFGVASKTKVGRPLLESTLNQKILRRISIYSALVGISANLAIAFRAGEEYTGITIAEFFVSFLHLALIASIARVIVATDRRRSIDLWVVIILIAEIAFVMVHNSRMTLMETFLCYVVTVSAFEYKIRWRQFVMVLASIAMMVIFITPIFLYVRNFRGDLSWTARITATVDATTNWQEAFRDFLQYRDKQDQLGWYLNYYGTPQNVFERMSHINHVDVLKNGADSWRKVGFEDLGQAFTRAMPRILSPDKPREYGQGYWLYSGMGIPYPGPFATAALIGNGYAAFSWIGAALYPLILGSVWLLIIKKVTGWELHGNIWVIYMLLRVHNQFVEGSTDAYLIYILRSIPQDFIILWILDGISRGSILNLKFKKRAISYAE